MAADSPLPPVALKHRRDATIARLCEHFARDHIEAEELERLIDRAHQATSLAELDAVLEGLPALQAPATPAPGVGMAPAHEREQEIVLAVMGGAERRGPWTPARRVYVSAVMGGVVLDLRDARLGPGVTEISILALMGGVEIIVPPGLAVESNGIGIMGGFDHAGHTRFPVDSAGPLLRVNGVALMGGVEIREKGPRMPRESGGTLSREERRRLERGEPRDGSDWGGWDR